MKNASRWTRDVTSSLIAKMVRTNGNAVSWVVTATPYTDRQTQHPRVSWVHICYISAVTCNEDRTFQCYDGTCIPQNRECDGMVDCSGGFSEDETAQCNRHSFTSCLDYYQLGYTENGIYTINPGGLGISSMITCAVYTVYTLHLHTVR